MRVNTGAVFTGHDIDLVVVLDLDLHDPEQLGGPTRRCMCDGHHIPHLASQAFLKSGELHHQAVAALVQGQLTDVLRTVAVGCERQINLGFQNQTVVGSPQSGGLDHRQVGLPFFGRVVEPCGDPVVLGAFTGLADDPRAGDVALGEPKARGGGGHIKHQPVLAAAKHQHAPARGEQSAHVVIRSLVGVDRAVAGVSRIVHLGERVLA